MQRRKLLNLLFKVTATGILVPNLWGRSMVSVPSLPSLTSQHDFMGFDDLSGIYRKFTMTCGKFSRSAPLTAVELKTGHTFNFGPVETNEITKVLGLT